MRKDSLSARILSILLAWSILTSPLISLPAWAQEQAEAAESFNFPETAGSVAEPLVGEGKKTALKSRTAPVTSSGDFFHTIDIDIPPGRLEMTPSLSLSYSSGLAKRDSAVGAGWTFGPGSISRSTLHGVPPLKRMQENLRYDDEKAVFESPAGRLVQATDGPAGAAGVLYAPLREQTPVRYEYLSDEGMWIEHDPSGIKRYYGADPGGRRVQIVNELGTQAWLLLLEVDPDGNHISYEYHNIDDQDRSNLKDPQRVPILSKVSWGGNRNQGMPHVFKATIEISAQTGNLDMLNGHVVLASKVDRIRVEGPQGEYWVYELGFEKSPDTGRYLLRKLARKAPGEAPRETTFVYSQNDPVAPRFVDAGPLPNDFPFIQLGGQAPQESWCSPPAPVHRIYSTVRPPVGSISQYPTIEAALNPPDFRSPHRFLDFDGDGDTDVLYHPAGIRTTASRLIFDQSFLQQPGQPWTAFQGEQLFGIPSTEYISQLGDADGDFDIDGITFPIAYSTGAGGPVGSPAGSGGPSPPGDVSDLCCSPGFWNACGNVDPVPEFRRRLERGPQTLVPGLGEARTAPRKVGGSTLGLQDAVPSLSGDQPRLDEVIRLTLGPGPWQPGDKIIAPLPRGDLLPPTPIPPPAPILFPPSVNCLPYVKACLSSRRRCGGPCDLPESKRPLFCDLVERGGFTGLRPVPGPGGSLCEGLFPSDLTEMPITVFTNQARSTALPMQHQQTLQWWPAGVGHRVQVTRKITVWGDRYSAEVLSDFLAPLTDVNADGRSDIVLLKYLNVPPSLITFPTYKFLPRAYLGKGDTYKLDLDFVPLGADCGDLLAPDNTNSTSEFTQSLVDILAGGFFYECKGDYANKDCILNRRFPHSVSFNTLLMDVNSDGLPDLVGARPPEAIGVEPRATKASIPIDVIQRRVAEQFRLCASQLKSDTDAQFISRPRHIAMYLAKKLTDQSDIEIAQAFAAKNEDIVRTAVQAIEVLRKTNRDVDFLANKLTAVLQKEAAQPQIQKKICVDGHKVYLNRGYRWDEVPLTDESWSSPLSYGYANLTTSPLLRLRNRERICSGLPYLEDSAAIPPEKQSYDDVRPLPLGAMAIVDINSDGRQDIVFAYSQKRFIKTASGYTFAGGTPAQSYKASQEVFLNTGRGFVKDNSNYGFPDPFYLAAEPLSGWVSGKTWESDLARFVDVDSDGLVDIVTAGYFQGSSMNIAGAGGPVFRCNPARWYRNHGVVPDLLVHVTSDSGAWTAIEYVAATWPQAHVEGIVASGGQLPPGHMVVKRIESAAGPDSNKVATGGHQFAAQTISLQYVNYVRDDLSSESIGFERVISNFTNSLPNGTILETVTVAREYEVTSSVGTVMVRHPLKGLEKVIEVLSGADRTVERYYYSLSPLGQAARIRQRARFSAECLSQSCKWSGREVTAFDDYGNARVVRAGNADIGGPFVVDDDQMLLTEMLYENRINHLWQIGLLADEKTFGYREEIGGTTVGQALLSHRSWVYDAKGRLEQRKRPNITPAGYAARLGIPTEDVVVYKYNALGLPEAIESNHYASGRGTVNLVYDLLHLYLASRQVELTRYTDGQPQAPIVLRETYERDLRTGELTKVTDFNGQVFTTERDSHGRPIRERGPGGLLMAEHTYQDSYPVTVTSVIHTDVGKSYKRVLHMDGENRLLSLIEGGGESPPLRRNYFVLDAFGRQHESYLPAFVSAFDDIAPSQFAPKKITDYDGLDRLLLITYPDGRTTHFTYQPWSTFETNPRGYGTQRDFDWRGNQVGVTKYDDGGTSLARYVFVRDGLGWIVRIVDPDGNIRQIEYDVGGRTRYVTLPHKPGAAPLRFSMAYDLDDQLVELITALGWTITITRDELARPVYTKAIDQHRTSETFLSYDDPQSSSLGRLWKTSDESGITSLSYDAFGRRKTIEYRPSPLVLSGAINLSSVYSAIFDHSPAGELRSFSLTGIQRPDGTPATISLVYSRDNMGRPKRVDSVANADTITLVSDVVYDAQDHLRHAKFGNGGSADWSYDTLREWLVNISYADHTGGVWGSVEYSHDANGNIKTETRKHRAATIASKVHDFDAMDRLVSTTLTTSNASEATTYEYSAGGNIIRAGPQTYRYDESRLAQAVTGISRLDETIRSLTYDDDGQLVRDEYLTSGSSGSSHKDTRDFIFDAKGCVRNVMARSEDSLGNVLANTSMENICGENGNRIYRKAVNNLTNSISRVLNFADLIELRPDENILLLRVPVGDTTLVEDARSLSNGERVEQKSGYVYSDARQSVLAVASFMGSATVQQEAEYDGWGLTVALSDLPPPVHAFVGHEPDPDTGYYYFGARVYDPTLRRFVSPDPLLGALPDLKTADVEQLNLYAYAANNPVRNTDATGLSAESEKEKKEKPKPLPPKPDPKPKPKPEAPKPKAPASPTPQQPGPKPGETIRVVIAGENKVIIAKVVKPDVHIVNIAEEGRSIRATPANSEYLRIPQQLAPMTARAVHSFIPASSNAWSVAGRIAGALTIWQATGGVVMQMAAAQRSKEDASAAMGDVAAGRPPRENASGEYARFYNAFSETSENIERYKRR